MSHKPWIMYETTEEIGQAIQQEIAGRLPFPVGLKVEEESFLIVLKVPGSEAHIRFTLSDLKSMYANASEFATFLESCWKDSMNHNPS